MSLTDHGGGKRRTTNSLDEIASSHWLSPGAGLRRLGCNYIRDLRLAKWGSGISLHGSSPEPLMRKADSG
jgi:hypothetical protein